MFSGGFLLLSNNSVNELCYVAQFVNNIDFIKNGPLNVVYSKIRFENDDFLTVKIKKV
jgi:hypothetical protein